MVRPKVAMFVRWELPTKVSDLPFRLVIFVIERRVSAPVSCVAAELSSAVKGVVVKISYWCIKLRDCAESIKNIVARSARNRFWHS